jgi:S-formylglutathione hydrolase FrmB
MLHGIGGHYTEWVAYGLAETAERLIQAGQIGPLIIVFPQGDVSYFVNHTRGDDELWGDYTAIDLVAHIDSTYRTIPTRDGRAIGGLSMGGFGALSLAFTHPDIYGVVGAHSPSLRTQGEAPYDLGAPPDYALIDPTELASKLNPATAPKIWIDLGVEDEWASRTSALKDELRVVGIHPDYSETDGGHDADYWRANAERYLRFYTGALAPSQGQ